MSWRNISWELPECWDWVSSWVTAIMKKSNVHFKCELRRLYTGLLPVAERVLCLGCFPPSSLATARLCKLPWLFGCLVSRFLHQWSPIVRGCWRPRKKCLRRNSICRPLRVILNGVSASHQKENLFLANMPGKLEGESESDVCPEQPDFWPASCLKGALKIARPSIRLHSGFYIGSTRVHHAPR